MARTEDFLRMGSQAISEGMDSAISAAGATFSWFEAVNAGEEPESYEQEGPKVPDNPGGSGKGPGTPKKILPGPLGDPEGGGGRGPGTEESGTDPDKDQDTDTDGGRGESGYKDPGDEGGGNPWICW
jgi:hypothetical protein